MRLVIRQVSLGLGIAVDAPAGEVARASAVEEGAGHAEEAVGGALLRPPQSLPPRQVRALAAAVAAGAVVALAVYLSLLSGAIAECEELWTTAAYALCSEVRVSPCTCRSVVVVGTEANVTAAVHLTGLERIVTVASGAAGDMGTLVRGLVVNNAATVEVLSMGLCAFEGESHTDGFVAPLTQRDAG